MMTPTLTTNPGDGPEDYRTSEGLRALLIRLHETKTWRSDPVARELMAYVEQKYAPLATRHHLDTWEAASAAFEAMLRSSTWNARDPWAVLTRAVQITCIAEERAQGMLCSVNRARRAEYSVFHDAERFTERETPLTDYHPVFHTTDTHPGIDETPETTSTAMMAIDDAVALLTLLGWPGEITPPAVEYICQILAERGDRRTAFEALRRAQQALAMFDMPATAWTGLLSIILGNPNPAKAATRHGHGLLLRLVIGETPATLLCDDDLVLAISVSAPRTTR